TVNIGLAVNGAPVLGVVFVPAKNELYYAAQGIGAFYQGADGPEELIHASAKSSIEEMALMKSRSHASEKLTGLLDKYHFASVKESGSSIKICRIARGEAEVYYRFGPTNEWDICAAHCVIKEAAGAMTALDGTVLNYNKPDPLNRGGFLASNNTIHQQLVKIAAEFSTAQ
ncbi:3'(2'),5'-bisphosphate nucleotidase CysQ, partial [bacterium]|nr:3'(2'),5'-bisphosphate nucleotidase CysQ [bacterium]